MESEDTQATPELITLDLPAEHVLSVDTEKRILGLRVIRYNEVVEHPAYGRLLFLPGAFVTPSPAGVRLRMDHEDPPTGIGIAYRDQPDAPYMDFRVSKTSRGDEQLTLARDGVSRGTSPGFRDVPGKPQQKLVDGKLTTVYGPGSALLAEVSTTWMPTFEGDGVVYVLSAKTEGEHPMDGTTELVAQPGIDYEQLANVTAGAIDRVLSSQRDADSESRIEKMLEKFDSMIELQRSAVVIPNGDSRPKPHFHHWVELTLKRMAGQSVRPEDAKALALDDVITTEQPGLVPTQFTPDYDDLISSARPFLSSTRRIEAPATGNSMVLPIITTRAVAGTQAGGLEKGALTTTATKVGTGTFAYQSVFGGADVSMQMILRAERSFFDLLTGDMGEAYALDAESKSIAALLTGYTDSASVAHVPVDGGVMDPEDPQFGLAWQTSILASKRAPDHVWLSSAAVAAFIDAKAPITNAPLYSQLAAAFTAGNGAGGRLSGLIPVYVPALDTADVDVIVGPSRGFVWAEDAARRLEADRPDVAGRDIAIVGGIFPAPRYANAFTTYVLAGS